MTRRAGPRREVPESHIKHATLEEAIYVVAPAWIGGDVSDVEVRAIVTLARAIEKDLYPKYYRLEPGELAAAAINEYFNG